MDRLMTIPATVGCVAVWAAGLLPAADAAPPRSVQHALSGPPSLRMAAHRVVGICLPRWHIVPGPTLGTSFLAGVAAVSARDVWAVGSVGTGTAARPLAVHWTGTRWQVAAGLTPPAPASTFFAYGSGAALVAVAALNTHDSWAVGSATTDAGTSPIVARWTGGRWRVVVSPYPGPSARLRAVAAISAHDVWAVGDVGSTRTLVEHWDGRSWRIVSTPRVSGQDVLLSGVVALSATDVWAVGSRGSQSDGSRRGLVEQWDGARWRVVPTPQPGGADDTLNGVAASSPDDVWAVGSAEGNDYQSAPLVERWDGRSWRVVVRPLLPASDNSLAAVAVRAARDVWAVGGGSVTHWTGARWSTTTLRTSSYVSGGDYTTASAPEFTAVTADPTGGLWAVGQVVLQTDEQNTTLVARDDATTCDARHP